MEISELESNVEIITSLEDKKVLFVCPVCKSKKALGVPKSVIEKAKQITTMSIARGLVCEHQFQAFVDKQFKVRGYQRVDFEFEKNALEEKNSSIENSLKVEQDLYDNLILEGNYLEYKTTKKSNNSNLKKGKEENQTFNHRNSKNHRFNNKKMILQEIYDEFYEFIDDDNEIFNTVIKKDLSSKRKTLSKY